MRRFTHYTTALFLAAASFFAVSCDDTDEVEVDPNDTTKTYDVTLEVNGTTDVNENFTVTSSTGSTIDTRVKFTGSGMKRLYITVDSLGSGEVPFVPFEEVDLKPDGSVGLENSASSEFDFEFELPVPDIDAGTYVYRFWATSGVGDFRDVEKRLVAGVGSITLNYGGSNPEATVKSYSVVMLVPPAADLSSATFLSLADGKTYKIKEGSEFAAFWDFGYYFTNQQQASFASTSAYEESFANLETGETFINVDSIAGTTELNNFYFASSTKTSAEFDAVETSGDLDDIDEPTEQKISGLEVGDIIEFVDNYGKKGLIRVTEIKGKFNAGDYIKLDIKVQP